MKNPGVNAASSADPLNTPVMRQYLDLKKKFPDSILFFRMGDFYEMFLEDAKEAAPIMDIAITKRQGDVPMAGVPYHSCDSYIARLIAAGRKVAIAEQEADPDNPKLMRRTVRRIISQGMLVEDAFLQSSSNNYIMSAAGNENTIGLSFADISTGNFFSFSHSDEPAGIESWVRDMHCRYRPREIIIASLMFRKINEILPEARTAITVVEDWKSSPIEGARQMELRYSKNLKALGYDSDSDPAIGAVSLILHYTAASFPGIKIELDAPVRRSFGGRSMVLDEHSIRNLDLVENRQEGTDERTLLGVIDFCRSAPGRRFMRDALLSPLIIREEILDRQKAVKGLLDIEPQREEIASVLGQVRDLERVLSRISSGRAAPRDFDALRSTLGAVQSLSKLVALLPVLPDRGKRSSLLSAFLFSTDLLDFFAELERSLAEELPALLGNGRFIRSGVRKDLDEASEASQGGARWIVEFEESEKKRTGITTLKVKYNKIVGYFIEISKGQAKAAPENYRRKQTLVGNERYSCEALDELETKILAADQEIARIEAEEFQRLCDRALKEREEIKRMMEWTARIDFLCALAFCARKYSWVCPVIEMSGEMLILDGRHPVVERFLPAGEGFIPNSLTMDGEERSFAVLTGPNMAGKSTFIRQTALIHLLAQIGSHVPAKHAVISIVDRIFTRIGASDNLTRGESTFFVEMLETARILNQCTDRSLIIMDEVGRGTSTYDGMSIAWAVAEYLTGWEDRAPRVLFATHYHELTALEGRKGVFNLTMEVQEIEGRVLFLRKVREGSADRSYGIHVARIAGLPDSVIDRASEKLQELEQEAARRKPPVRLRSQSKTEKTFLEQPGLF